MIALDEILTRDLTNIKSAMANEEDLGRNTEKSAFCFVP